MGSGSMYSAMISEALALKDQSLLGHTGLLKRQLVALRLVLTHLGHGRQ
jgi:hypothetical protein